MICLFCDHVSCVHQVIQNIQNMLVPEAANIVFMSPRVGGECSSKEPWFGTSYAVEGKELVSLPSVILL